MNFRTSSALALTAAFAGAGRSVDNDMLVQSGICAQSEEIVALLAQNRTRQTIRGA